MGSLLCCIRNQSSFKHFDNNNHRAIHHIESKTELDQFTTPQSSGKSSTSRELSLTDVQAIDPDPKLQQLKIQVQDWITHLDQLLLRYSEDHYQCNIHKACQDMRSFLIKVVNTIQHKQINDIAEFVRLGTNQLNAIRTGLKSQDSWSSYPYDSTTRCIDSDPDDTKLSPLNKCTDFDECPDLKFQDYEHASVITKVLFWFGNPNNWLTSGSVLMGIQSTYETSKDISAGTLNSSISDPAQAVSLELELPEFITVIRINHGFIQKIKTGYSQSIITSIDVITSKNPIQSFGSVGDVQTSCGYQFNRSPQIILNLCSEPRKGVQYFFGKRFIQTNIVELQFNWREVIPLFTINADFKHMVDNLNRITIKDYLKLIFNDPRKCFSPCTQHLKEKKLFSKQQKEQEKLKNTNINININMKKTEQNSLENSVAVNVNEPTPEPIIHYENDKAIVRPTASLINKSDITLENVNSSMDNINNIALYPKLA